MEVPNQESNNCTIKQDNKKPGNNRQNPFLHFETSFLCYACFYVSLSRTTDTRRLNPKFFAAQIQIPIPNKYLGCRYKGRVIFVEIMVEQWKTWTKDSLLGIGADSLAKNTPMPQNLSAQTQKFAISMKKRLHWASVVRGLYVLCIMASILTLHICWMNFLRDSLTLKLPVGGLFVCILKMLWIETTLDEKNHRYKGFIYSTLSKKRAFPLIYIRKDPSCPLIFMLYIENCNLLTVLRIFILSVY